MAIIHCPNCGADISDKAERCVHCGFAIAESKRRVCPECGSEVRAGATICEKCGYPIGEESNEKNSQNRDNNSQEVTRTIDALNAGTDSQNSKKTVLTSNKKTIGIVIAIVLIFVVVIVNQNQLKGNEINAFNLVLGVADQFSNPTSVRLVSGTVSDTGTSMACGISAINYSGVRRTNYYFISLYGFTVSPKDNPTSEYKDTTSLNIKKINKHLEKAFKTWH